MPSSVGLPPRVGAGDVDGSPASTTVERQPILSEPPPPDGGFWDVDPSDAKPKRKSPGLQGHARTLLEWVTVAVGALAVALLIKAFLLQAFYIPSGSMEPTLRVDDRVLVNKLSYRLGDIHRGDVIVFARPQNAPGTIDDFIKRVIGLPGETISFSDGSVFIDGLALEESYVQGAPSTTRSPIRGCANETPVADMCTVPEGMFFVMGDNRTGSQDSRIFGPIDDDSIVGRAFIKVWPLGEIGFL